MERMDQRSSFERLTLPHLDAAFNLAFWLVRSEADAEDIVQDAYVRAVPWVPWVCRNRRQAVAARYRAQCCLSLAQQSAALGKCRLARSGVLGGPGNEPAEAQIVSEDPTPEAQLLGAVDRGLVRSAIAELSPIFREVIVLREIEGLAYREISRVTGAPIGTVMSRLARGRRELRETLGRMMDQGKTHAVCRARELIGAYIDKELRKRRTTTVPLVASQWVIRVLCGLHKDSAPQAISGARAPSVRIRGANARGLCWRQRYAAASTQKGGASGQASQCPGGCHRVLAASCGASCLLHAIGAGDLGRGDFVRSRRRPTAGDRDGTYSLPAAG